MIKNYTPMLDRVVEMEKNLQEIKVDLMLSAGKEKKTREIYKEDDILKEVKRIRKQLWNEKYSKIA
jgi:hypothetical protein